MQEGPLFTEVHAPKMAADILWGLEKSRPPGSMLYSPMTGRLPFRTCPPGCVVGDQAGACCWLLLESSVVGDLAGGAGGGFSFAPPAPDMEDSDGKLRPEREGGAFVLGFSCLHL